MPSASRYQSITPYATIGLFMAAASLATFLVLCWKDLKEDHTGSPVSPVATPVPAPAFSSNAWSCLWARGAVQPGDELRSSSPDHLRLAGTFSIEGLGEPRRKAIIDDSLRHDQVIAGEGEPVGDGAIEKVYADHVVIQFSSGTKVLWIDFAGANSLGNSGLQRQATNLTAQSVGSGSNRFGCVRTEENRWRFSRKPLMDYYQELMDEPDRMAAVFDTMKPVRDERNKITGYVVGLEGENEFFDAVGLQQGDVVRAVNSFPMTNRGRAEAFIDQFLKDQLNVIVLDVERAGATVKQVYQMQP